MGRDRDDSGKFSEEITLDNVSAVFDSADPPVLTASEVATELDCSRSSAYNKLESLVERGEIEKKKVGARAVVYFRLG